MLNIPKTVSDNLLKKSRSSSSDTISKESVKHDEKIMNVNPIMLKIMKGIVNN